MVELRITEDKAACTTGQQPLFMSATGNPGGIIQKGEALETNGHRHSKLGPVQRRADDRPVGDGNHLLVPTAVAHYRTALG